MGIICPQAPGHIGDARAEVAGAAEQYARTKSGRQATEAKCRERGIVFQPLIFESTGGVTREVEETIKVICKAVANNTGCSYASVAQHLWRRLSIDTQKAGHRALMRRMAEGSSTAWGGVAMAAEAGELLEAPLHL